MITQEINIKSISYVEKASDLVEESFKPNHRVLGKKVGGSMKAIQAEVEKWGIDQIQTFEKNGKANIQGFELSVEDLTVVRKAKPGKFAQSENYLVVELDTALTRELLKEGLQRDCINRIQQTRKEMKLHLADRIRITWNSTPGSLLEDVLKSESNIQGVIARETLAREIVISNDVKNYNPIQESFGDHGQLEFAVEKVWLAFNEN